MAIRTTLGSLRQLVQQEASRANLWARARAKGMPEPKDPESDKEDVEPDAGVKIPGPTR